MGCYLAGLATDLMCSQDPTYAGIAIQEIKVSPIINDLGKADPDCQVTTRVDLKAVITP